MRAPAGFSFGSYFIYLSAVKPYGSIAPKGFGDIGAVTAAHVDHEAGRAEFLHDLTADAAGRENIGGVAVLAADDGDGGKLPLALGDGLENAVRSAQLLGP